MDPIEAIRVNLFAPPDGFVADFNPQISNDSQHTHPELATQHHPSTHIGAGDPPLLSPTSQHQEGLNGSLEAINPGLSSVSLEQKSTAHLHYDAGVPTFQQYGATPNDHPFHSSPAGVPNGHTTHHVDNPSLQEHCAASTSDGMDLSADVITHDSKAEPHAEQEPAHTTHLALGHSEHQARSAGDGILSSSGTTPTPQLGLERRQATCDHALDVDQSQDFGGSVRELETGFLPCNSFDPSGNLLRVEGAGVDLVNGIYHPVSNHHGSTPRYANSKGSTLLQYPVDSIPHWFLSDSTNLDSDTGDYYLTPVQGGSNEELPLGEEVPWGMAQSGEAPFPVVSKVTEADEIDFGVESISPGVICDLIDSAPHPWPRTTKSGASIAAAKQDAARVIIRRLIAIEHPTHDRELLEALRRHVVAQQTESDHTLQQLCLQTALPYGDYALADLLYAEVRRAIDPLPTLPPKSLWAESLARWVIGQVKGDEPKEKISWRWLWDSTKLSVVDDSNNHAMLDEDQILESGLPTCFLDITDTKRSGNLSKKHRDKARAKGGRTKKALKPLKQLSARQKSLQRAQRITGSERTSQLYPDASGGSDYDDPMFDTPLPPKRKGGPAKFCTDEEFDVAWRYINAEVARGVPRQEASKVALRELLGNRYQLSSLKVKMWRRDKQIEMARMRQESSKFSQSSRPQLKAGAGRSRVSHNTTSNYGDTGAGVESSDSSESKRKSSRRGEGLLTERRTHESIGIEFQASLPNLLSVEERDVDKEESLAKWCSGMVWQPSPTAEQQAACDEFLAVARQMKTMLKSMPAVEGAPTHCAIPLLEYDEAYLQFLQSKNHDAAAALADIGAVDSQIATVWSLSEQRRFEKAIARYGTDLTKVSRMIPTKSLREVVCWFSHRQHTAVEHIRVAVHA